MKGVWLTKHEATSVLSISQKEFEKTYEKSLKWNVFGSRKKYFITDKLMPKEAKKNYEAANKLIDVDDDAAEVEEVLGDITSLQQRSQ